MKTGFGYNAMAVVLAILFLPVVADAEIRVISEKGLYGIADSSTGNVLVRPRYRHLDKVKEDFFLAREHGNMGVINSEGATIIDFRYSDIRPTGTYSRINTDFLIARLKYEETSHSREFQGWSKSHKVEKVGRKTVTREVSKPVYKESTVTKREFQCGVIGPTGEILIPFNFDGLHFTSVPGVFIAEDGEKDKKYGLVSVNDDLLVPMEYDRIGNVRTGPKNTILVTVLKQYKEEDLVLNVSGSQPAAERVEKFKKGNLVGFRTGDGKELIPPAFEDAWDFKNGFARIKRDGKWGFIDSKGQMVVDPQFDYVWDFDGGKAKVRLADGGIKYVDPAGKLLEE